MGNFPDSIIISLSHYLSIITSQKNFTLKKRAMGVEPTQTAWKAVVLPLHHARNRADAQNGRGRIRTSVGIRQQIYSLPPLTTREPVRQKASRQRESNPRPEVYKTSALPAELCRQNLSNRKTLPLININLKKIRVKFLHSTPKNHYPKINPSCHLHLTPQKSSNYHIVLSQ